MYREGSRNFLPCLFATIIIDNLLEPILRFQHVIYDNLLFGKLREEN